MCRKCPWEKMASLADEMVASGDFKWAYDFLTSSSRWMRSNQHVTARQIESLIKISAKGKRHVPKDSGKHERKRSGLFS